MKRISKGFVSVLLVLAVMLSLAVPFEITVYAEEETPATDSQIYALLYIKDESKTGGNKKFDGHKCDENLELVFQKGDKAESGRTLVATYSGFAGTKYHYRDFKSNTKKEMNTNKPGYKSGSDYILCPWYASDVKDKNNTTVYNVTNNARNIVKVDFKDEIRPTYTASWFYGCNNLSEIAHFTNLDTSECKDMSWMFSYVHGIEKLDLSHFDVRNVEEIDYFIQGGNSSSNKLHTVIMSGLNWKLDSVLYMKELIYQCPKLVNVDLSGVDISHVKSVNGFINECNSLETLDVSSINPTSAYDFLYAFQNDKGLRTVKFGLFQPGKDNQEWELFRLNGMFNNCELLETVDFATWDLPLTRTTNEGGTKETEVRPARIEYASFFKNCKSLKKLTAEEHFQNLIFKYGSPGTWINREMFCGCESLEEVDFSGLETFIGGISIFKGCKNLRKINVARMGNKYATTDLWQRRYGFSSYDTSGNNAMRYNIYEGCENLSEFTFSEWYPPQIVYDNRSNTLNPLYYDTLKYYDPNKTLVGDENPDIPPIDLDRYWIKIKQPEEGTCSIPDSQLVPVGEQVKASDLFGDFQRRYAGTWVTKAAVVLDAAGGVPALQSIESAVGLTVDYDPDTIQKPVKTGYEFAGWYAKDEEGNEKRLETQLAANQEDPENNETIAAWTYKAKWDENTYTLKLFGNGGETDDHLTEVTADDDLLYSEYYDLNNGIFKRDGYVLSGWNTRPNGSGDAYTANEAVNKLTATNHGEAKLYAQWHKPDVIITFDPQGGTAVANKNYTLVTGETTYYGDLAESTKNGYTFVGWYTAAEGGTKIKTETEVGASCKLYAHWVENPTITFDANGGGSAYFDDDSTKTVMVKHYKYGQNLGVLPTPYYGASELDGWYTERTGGTKVTSETRAEENTTYYAHWGYKPQFDSNGGVYTNATVTKIFPAYKVETDANYVIYKTSGSDPDHPRPTLPEFTVTQGFKGWMFGNRNLSEELENNESVTINLSSGTHVIADWETKTINEVTLDPRGGTLSKLYYDEEHDKYRVNVYDGKTVEELPAPTLTENGVEYEFLGWYDAVTDGNKKDYTFAPESSCTLYAHWAAKELPVTFDPNGGALFLPDEGLLTRTEMVYSGGTVKKLPGANRDGFVFDGWYTDVTDETTKLTTSTPITAGVTYYAKWTATENTLITSSDNIYKYTVRWATQSNEYATNTGDSIVIAPQTGASGVSVALYVEFDFNQAAAALSTPSKVLAPESVKIKIPKYIFQNSSGTNIGSNNIGNGMEKKGGDTLDSNFVYDDTSDDDYYIIYNNDAIDGSAFQNQVFTISYSLDPEQLRSLNGGYTDETGAYAGNYFNRSITTNPISVSINVAQEGVAATDYTKKLGLEVHTDAKTSALKEQANASFGWNTDWGPKPADADQYFYVTWTLTSSHEETSSQKFKVSWSEDPVHEGSVVYTKTQGGDKFYQNGTFRTTVVTKHPHPTGDSGWKNVYNEAVLTVQYISGHEEQYRVSRTAGVYILPDGDTRVFEKFIKDYGKVEASRFKEGAQELILNRTGYNYLPFSIRYQEYKNLDNNKQWYENTKTYTTVEREMMLSDGAKGDKDIVLSTVKGATPYSWNTTSDPSSAPVGEALGDADYHFNYLDLYLTEFDAVYLRNSGSSTGEWSEPYQHDAYKDYDDIEVWIRAEGSSNFSLFKTVKANDLEKSEGSDEQYGVAHANIILPEKTVGYQIKHKSDFYTTKLVVNPNLCLNASNKVFDRVRDDVAAGKNTLIKNKCTLTVTGRSDGAATDSRDMETNGGYPSSYELTIGESTLYAAQNCNASASTYAVTDENGVQQIPAVMHGWGISSSVDANNDHILKLIDSGVFYDLLPVGFTVDKNTVFIRPRNKHTTEMGNGAGSYDTENRPDRYKFPSGYYSVDLIENWQGSGCTMMKVTVNTPEDITATGYSVYFKMKTTLGNILTNGEYQTNSVCFIDTTENQSPPKYKFNSISSGIDEKSRIYFKDLDSDYTAFTNGTTACYSPSQYSTGFKSSVRADGDVMFKDQTVGLDSGYTYEVSFLNGNQPTKDLIFYDVIENSLTGDTYDWHGEFQSVDISGIGSLVDNSYTGSNTRYYCAPKVYYCITDDPITEEDLDITKAIWTDTAPSDADKARVKAVAVDCRKNTGKGDFVLPDANTKTNGKKSSVTFSVLMKSPESNQENDVMTYNESYIKYTTSDVAFNNTSLSKVRLHFANPGFHKSSFPETGADADHRTGVVNDSTIEYYLEVSNPDEYVNIKNITVEDLLDSNLILTNTVKVKLGDEEPIAINKHTRISEYAVATQNGRAKFIGKISYLAPGETITIIVPATVDIDPSIDVEHNTVTIDNSARITSVNNSDAAIPSETTYHYVTVCKAKIKKEDVNKNAVEGATLQILNKDKTTVLHQFISTDDVYTTNLEPGEYVLRELYAPGQDEDHPDAESDYKKAADIPFTIDVEGIHYVGGQKVSYVEMIDEPAYKVIFHENQPDHDDAVFRVYGPADLDSSGMIDHFYDIPEWAGDEYVFAGWYHGDASSAGDTPVSFESDTYPKVIPEGAAEPQDYHLYAKWLRVGTVDKDSTDSNNYGEYPIRGFGLAGVQVRNPEMADSNYGSDTEAQPGGLRFVTSLSEDLLSQINALSGQPAEYGYAVGTEANINAFTGHYGVLDTSKYKLQYNGLNVNGVNTSGKDSSGKDLPKNQLNAQNDFRYVTNVNCTSKHGNASSAIKDDHKNFGRYRLYTLVVTYEGASADKKNEKLDARAYIRYTDANGMVRVFYNDYMKNMYYGGCLCSFSQVSQIAIPKTTTE